MAFTLPNTIDPGTEIVAAELEGNFQAVKTDLNSQVARIDGSVAMTGELLLSGPPTTALSAATKAFVEAWMPIQFAYPCFSPAAPSGFVFPTGQTYARTAAPLMAAAIAPDASSPYWVDATNFKYPDMRDRVPVGKGTVRTVLDEKIGSKDAVVITHAHTTTHSHGASGLTASQGTHAHTEGSPTGALGWLYSGAYDGVNYDVFVGSNLSGARSTLGYAQPSTTAASAGGISVGGSTASTAAGSDSQGVSGTNLNYQPSIVCNWAMRLA